MDRLEQCLWEALIKCELREGEKSTLGIHASLREEDRLSMHFKLHRAWIHTNGGLLGPVTGRCLKKR